MKDIQSMTDEELKQVIAQAQQEQEKRKQQRFAELVSQFITAARQLKKEFPFAQCIIEGEEEEFDVLDCEYHQAMFSE